MIDPPRLADFAIWLVALALYVGDAARLLTPRQLLLVEAAGGRLASVFSAYPFTLGRRALVFAPLVLPQRGAFVTSWGRPWSAAPALRAALESVQALRGTLRLARILAVWTFVLLFAVGPALTLSVGTDPAVLITAAHPIEVDGAQVLVATAAADVKAEFLGRLTTRTEELINETADDADGQAALRAYLDVVRTAR